MRHFTDCEHTIETLTGVIFQPRPLISIVKAHATGSSSSITTDMMHLLVL
jgi:hypothetical protein